MAKTKRHNRKIASLRRRGPRRKPKRSFVLVCEGEKTEPLYFYALEAAFSSTLVELEIVKGVGVALTVAQKAAELARDRPSIASGKSDSFMEGDQIWAVFDVDDHPYFDEAVTLCEEHGVRVGRSNPCFELWLILHETDYDQLGACKAVQRELHAVHPEYHRKRGKTANFGELVAHVEAAEERAISQLQRRADEGNRYGNPSTTVGNLVRSIRQADQSWRR